MIDIVIDQRRKDLGGFEVGRVLPVVPRRMVGPFIFFDHMGPADFAPGLPASVDVRPHPHIGLSTITYLFEGEIMHRDSLGTVQAIRPGAVNWMTAGRGIVHSERTPDDLRSRVRRSHGLQLWVALPAEHEEDAPGFEHTPASAIPSARIEGVTVRVLVGDAFGLRSPVRTSSPTLYVDFDFGSGGNTPISVPAAAEERALYGVDQAFTLDGAEVPAHTLAVLPAGTEPRLAAAQGGRVVLVGGAPLGHRFIVWNFVSSRKERVVQAQDAWDAQAMGQVPGETEFIPLPPRWP